MSKMTRRALLWATPAGVAALGGVAALLTTFKSQDKAHAQTSTAAATTGALTVYVKDVTKSDVSLFMGEQEIVIQDAALVAQLLGKFH